MTTSAQALTSRLRALVTSVSTCSRNRHRPRLFSSSCDYRSRLGHSTAQLPISTISFALTRFHLLTLSRSQLLIFTAITRILDRGGSIKHQDIPSGVIRSSPPCSSLALSSYTCLPVLASYYTYFLTPWVKLLHALRSSPALDSRVLAFLHLL